MTRRYLIGATIFFAILFASLVTLPAEAFTGKGCGTNCTDCHTLDKDEAGKLLKVESFKADVVDIRMAPVKGLWEVELKRTNGMKVIIYVDFAKKYLIEGRFTKLAEVGKGPDLRQLDLKKIPLKDAIVIGKKRAKHRIIVFDDPDCPYCRKLHKEMEKIVKERKDVAFFIKLYPLPIHKEAYEKSKAIVCERSLSLLEDAINGKELPKASCETDVVDETIALAHELGIGGTPAIIFPNGKLLPGYLDAEGLLFLLDNNLE